MTPTKGSGPPKETATRTTNTHHDHHDGRDGVEFSSAGRHSEDAGRDDLFAYLYYTLGETPGQLCIAVGHDPEMVDGRLET